MHGISLLNLMVTAEVGIFVFRNISVLLFITHGGHFMLFMVFLRRENSKYAMLLIISPNTLDICYLTNDIVDFYLYFSFSGIKERHLRNKRAHGHLRKENNIQEIVEFSPWNNL